jgi:hypothetical protein
MGYEDMNCCNLVVDRTQFFSLLSMKKPYNSIKYEDFFDQLRGYYLFEDIRTYMHTLIHIYIYIYIYIYTVMNACFLLCSLCVSIFTFVLFRC